MAELKNHEEPTLPSKRKPQDTEELPQKVPKLATLDHSETEEPNANSNNNDNNNSEVPSTNCSSTTEEKTELDVNPKEGANDGNEHQNDDVKDEEEDDDDDDDDDDEVNEVDRKGKGVLRDDKGKGKLIEEEEEDEDDDDSDDDDDDSDDGDGDSDFSDDPLAEVDLNNILPSRTRRRTTLPGVHIASDMGIAEEDDDDSDDRDA